MARKIREKGLREGWEEIDGVLHHKSHLYLRKIIITQTISKNHNDLLIDYFGVEKTRELIARKYYWQTLQFHIEAYVKGYNISINPKAVGHKFYGDLQSLPLPTHHGKDLSIDFVTGLPVSKTERAKHMTSSLSSWTGLLRWYITSK